MAGNDEGGEGVRGGMKWWRGGEGWQGIIKGLPRKDSMTATPSGMYQFSPSGTVDISGN